MDTDKLILENEKLIYYTLKKMQLYHLKDDYYDLGMIGLVQASQTYNGKYAFSTYACKCIANSINVELRKNKAKKRQAKIISLSECIKDDITLENIIPADVNIENEAIKKELLTSIYTNIERLDDRSQKILKKYYGLGTEKKTQKAIAEEYGISQAQVARIVQNSIKTLKKICD